MKLLYTLFCIINIFSFTLMINPAGDAQNAGRVVGDSFERGLTLQFAEMLHQKLQDNSRYLRVVLTRFPGETLETLQAANFSNRLQADLFISLHLYETKDSPKINFYYYAKDIYEQHFRDNLFLCSLEDAHRFKNNISKKIAEDLYNNLNNITNFSISKPLGMPVLPLKGLVAPSVALEIGLKNNNDWQELISPIVSSIHKIIRQDL